MNEEILDYKQKCLSLAQELNLDIKDKRSKELWSILSKLQTDEPTMVSAYFLQYVRLKQVDLDIIKQNFNEETSELINSILKMELYDSVGEENEAAMIRNMLVAIAKDIRVIMVKLAEILFLARHLDLMSVDKQKDFHKQVTDIYVPLSARLGFNFIKSELQNLNLKFTKPREYYDLEKEVNAYKTVRMRQINITCNKLNELCENLNIDAEVYGRVKNISSIYNKLADKNLKLNQIYDLSAVRVIVNEVNECYTVLSAVYSIYKPIDGRFKDYIARPKANGYESLHTTVIADNQEPIEIQIRTRQMHEFAEYGVAAHWLYKEKKSKRNLVEEKLTAIRKIIENPEENTIDEIIDSLKTDVYLGEIFVQTPKGKVIQLVDGSTPIDFAYAIHGKVGNSCIGAKVNGRMTPLNTLLSNGDEVEIITSQTAKGPSRDWLKFVKTSQARKQINSFFRKEMKEENIKMGKSMLEQASKVKDISLHLLLKDDWLKQVFDKYSLKNLDEMYASVGYGTLSTSQVLNKLIALYKQEHLKEEMQQMVFKNSSNEIENLGDSSIVVKGTHNLMVRFASCCSPIPGDEIVGFVSRSKGVTVHRKNCPNVKGLDEDRLIEVSWGAQKDKNYVVSLVVECKNSEGMLLNITKVLFESKINITSVNTRSKDNLKTKIDISISINNPENLQKLISNIKSIPNVYDVYRKKGV